MSWNVQMAGKPEAVHKALETYGDTLTGQSREEFEEARPALQTLVAANVSPNVVVKLNASGHATLQDGKKTYGSCSVALDQFYGLVTE